MTYEQIEKMSKDDLVFAFKRMTEIAEEIGKDLARAEQLFNDRDETFEPYGHIGHLEANLVGTKIRLESVIEVVTKK